MGRRRKKNKGLPERVYIDYGKQRKDGTWPKPRYYLKKPDNTQVFLGNTEIEMRRNHLALIERPKYVQTTEDLFTRYMQEVACKKSPRTYKNNLSQIKFLTAFFKDLDINDITPQHIYQYMDIRRERGVRAANGDKALLSNIFSYAIRWGLAKDNPCKLVKAFEEKPRDRYPEDWELKAVYNEGSEILKCIIDFGYLTGQRIGDILTIQETQISEEGIKIYQAKTKHKVAVKLLIQWSPALEECVKRARNLRGMVRSLYLFSKDDGQSYSYFGFRSMFKRAMVKALEKGTLLEKFNFHDIRAKTYSDEEDEAQKIKRAGHTDASMAKTYDRKFKKVRPLK
jgi:integrase